MLKKTNTQLIKQRKPIVRDNIYPPVPTPVPTTTESITYINGFSTLIGDTDAKIALRSFITSKKLTSIIYYTGSSLDNSTNRAYLRALNAAITITKGANVTKSINAITESDLGTPAGYNTTCLNDNEKFTMFSQEWEFWKSNPNGDWEAFKTNDLAIYNYCQSHNITYNIYVARCKDPKVGGATPEQVADWLVAKHDTIYLVDYCTTDKFNTYQGLSAGIQAQIQLIADAAKRFNNGAGKIQNMAILWASEGNVVNGVPENMRTFFVQNPSLIAAYTKFKAVYDNWKFTNKDNVKFVGQNIYGYNGIKDL